MRVYISEALHYNLYVLNKSRLLYLTSIEISGTFWNYTLPKADLKVIHLEINHDLHFVHLKPKLEYMRPSWLLPGVKIFPP